MSVKPRRSANAAQHPPSGVRPTLRCAIHTRVSTEHGLEQEFNSLDNQREAAEARPDDNGASHSFSITAVIARPTATGGLPARMRMRSAKVERPA